MKKKNLAPSPIKRVLRYIKKYSALLILSVLLSLITVGLTLYIPIIIGDAIDLIAGKDNVPFSELFKLLANAGIISVIIALLQWIMNTINNK